MLYLLIGLLAVLFVSMLAIQEHARDAVRERFYALDGVDAAAAWACFDRAEKLVSPWRTLRDHLIAPVVLLIPLLRLPREANDLPEPLAYWRNNVSINGDGKAVLRDGKWIDLQDIGWKPQPGERVYSYDDADYTGDAYYCRGHHPRSWLARYVWLALRNVASQRDVLAGADVARRPAVLAESPGLTLLWDGGQLYQLTLEAPLFWGLRWRANVGYKLGIVANRPDPLTPSEGGKIGSARASAICTWFSLKGGA